MGGTSMAAPVCAGAMALVRQYIREGFYPTGSATEGAGWSASGALLRALALNSAQRLTGSTDASGAGGSSHQPLGRRVPNNEQGYGALTLARALRFDPPVPGGPSALWLRDDSGAPVPHRAPCFLETGQVFAWAFSVRAGEAFKATLAWTDSESSLTADVVLNNDLDLEVCPPPPPPLVLSGHAASLTPY